MLGTCEKMTEEKGRQCWVPVKPAAEGILWKFLETVQKSVTELSLLRVEGALIFMHQLLRIIPIKFPSIGNTPLRYRTLRHRDVDPGSWKSAGGYLSSTGYEQGPDNICYSH